ncbi:hypothetical protein Ping_1600 [Psychromonas ingrahamii 37]|uniref:Uncharacterized protein n=1 Tax=Psychromonas ingrahamii (strain DSM 17664 / CCUG 51855 / 37) TaxID=357804 RepID=A1SV82_PSYIN|nr:hypothetical protein [Psychromonas ingrahamii]ABM03397.1 hypothetical protein Ping_1600 [Psychromonas ingrahamii 37]
MNKKNRPQIQKREYSISDAAKVLETSEEFLIKLIVDRKIRACVLFVDFHPYQSHSAVFVSTDIDTTEANKQWLKRDELDTNTVEDEFGFHPENSDGEDLDNCPLNRIFGTYHSKIQVSFFNMDENGRMGEILYCWIKGLWEIEPLDEIKELITHSSETPILINVVPYMPEGLYHYEVDKIHGAYLGGFAVDVAVQDIRISYDDMQRLHAHLDGGEELVKLDGNKMPLKELNELNELKERNPRSPSIQASTLLVQILDAYCPFADELFNEPSAAMELLEKDFAFKLLKAPKMSAKTLYRMIKAGKERL